VSTKFVKKKALGSKLAPPQGVIDFPYMNKMKTYKSSLRTQRARAKIFSIKHFLMDVYQVCSNKRPVVKIGPAQGDIDHPYMCIAKS
jgi:hypothetical protein